MFEPTEKKPLSRFGTRIVNSIVNNFDYYTDFKLGTEGYISYIKSNELYETLKKDEENRESRKGEREGGERKEEREEREGGERGWREKGGEGGEGVGEGIGRNGTRSESQEWLMEKLKAINERDKYSPGLDVHPSANGLRESGGNEKENGLKSVKKTKVLKELLIKSNELNDIMIQIANSSYLVKQNEKADAQRKARLYNNYYKEMITDPRPPHPTSVPLKNLSRSLDRIIKTMGNEGAFKKDKENLIRYIMFLLNNYAIPHIQTTPSKIQDLYSEITTNDQAVKDNLLKIYTNMAIFYQSLT